MCFFKKRFEFILYYRDLQLNVAYKSRKQKIVEKYYFWCKGDDFIYPRIIIIDNNFDQQVF